MLAMPRVIAWRIHHVAYVENLKPLRQSNFSTACISPRLPSWMRSSSGSPDAWYFLAMETTSRRFDCTNWRSASSPWRAVRRSSRRRGAAASLPPLSSASIASLPASIALARRTSSSLVNKRVLADVGEIQPNEIFVIAVNAIFGHHGSLSYQPAAGVSRFSPVPTG